MSVAEHGTGAQASPEAPPEGWPPHGWPAATRRFREQRWLVDLAIRTVGLDWDQGRSRYIPAGGGGEAVAAFAAVRERVASLADFTHEFATAGERHEALAAEADAAGETDAAAIHAFIAALLWGAAEWPFFVSRSFAEQARAAGARKVAAYRTWMIAAPHPVLKLEIAAGERSLPGILHLPPGAEGPVPAVLHVGGMDSFKEHAVAARDDRWLQRGIARLVVDLPGQGEAIWRGVPIGPRGVIDYGLAALDVLRSLPEIDGQRLGLTGVSFGSYWATELAAHAPELRGTAVWAVCHEPGMQSIFETASPTFKARFMAMAGMTDEPAFDEFARGYDLRPLAPRIRHPYLAIAGEDDELSPVQHTLRIVRSISAPASLVVYRGERHSVGGASSARLGPNHLDLAADWLTSRLDGRAPDSTLTVVDTDGPQPPNPSAPGWRSASRRSTPDAALRSPGRSAAELRLAQVAPDERPDLAIVRGQRARGEISVASLYGLPKSLVMSRRVRHHHPSQRPRHLLPQPLDEADETRPRGHAVQPAIETLAGRQSLVVVSGRGHLLE